MHGNLDRDRASDLMQECGLDALVLCEPEAFQYVMGVWAGPASLFRRAGSQFVVVPQNPDLPMGAVVTDFDADRIRPHVPDVELRTHPAWIETVVANAANAELPLERQIEMAIGALDRPVDFVRPATFDSSLSVAELKTLLTDFAIDRGRLGVDLAFVPAADLSMLLDQLPNHSLENGSPLIDRLRAIKNRAEIELLRQGIQFSEQGFRRLEADARIGMRQGDLIGLYRSGVAAASKDANGVVTTAEYMSLGARQKTTDEPAEMGDPVKADMVCAVDGYQADMSRNFVFGESSKLQHRLHEIAETAFERGLAALGPGHRLCDVHREVTEALAELGLPSYRRGHFGHGVGFSVFSEQWPFIAADCTDEIEPGMVLAYEIPLYVEGIGSFNLEDQFLITQSGPQSMNTMPRRLGRLS